MNTNLLHIYASTSVTSDVRRSTTGSNS
jgi:hypothetical protein